MVSWYIKAMGLQLSGADLLKMPEALWVCNGIGPEWFPAWLRHLINLICPSLVLVAHIHDLRYHIGGTEDDRRAADAEFMANVLIVAEARYKYFPPLKWLTEWAGFKMFRLLRLAGRTARKLRKGGI